VNYGLVKKVLIDWAKTKRITALDSLLLFVAKRVIEVKTIKKLNIRIAFNL